MKQIRWTMKRIGGGFLLIALLTLAGWSQTRGHGAAVIDGTVTAGTTPLPGAVVTVGDAQGHRRATTTDVAGRFRLTAPAEGSYTVTVEFPGFGSQRQQVQAMAGRAASLAFHLGLAEPARARPAARPGAAAAGRQGYGFQRARLQSNPVNAMAGMPAMGDAGVDMTGAGMNGDESTTGEGDTSASATGVSALPGMNADTAVDSMSVAGNLGQNEMPPPGQRRFRRGGPGNFRRGPGGPGGPGGPRGGPSMVRGGGGRRRFNPNTPHGAVFYTLGDSALDARPYALSGVAAPKQSYSRQRMGAMIGGPLRIPHVYEGGHTFLFFGFFLNHDANPFDAFSTVPTLAERQGDFSGVTGTAGPLAGQPIQIYNPATHQPFATGVIPAALLNPAALNLLQYIPLPNQPGATRNFHYSSTDTSDNHRIFMRVMHSFGGGGFFPGPMRRRNSINFGLNYEGSNAQDLKPFPTVGGTTQQRGMNVQIGYSNTYGHLVNMAHVSYNRSRISTANQYAFNTDVAGQAGITGISASPFDWGVPGLSFTHYTGLSDVTPVLQRNQTFTVSDTMMERTGRHILRFGGDFRRIQQNPERDSNPNGSFVFSGLSTAAQQNGAPVSGTGYDFADFLLGQASQTTLSYTGGPFYFRGDSWDLFLQDNWQLRSNLTLNLGIRYEYVTPFSEKYGRMVTLDVAQGFTAVAPVEAGQKGPYTGIFPFALVKADKNNFAPRLGIAWAPNRQTVVRAGYGINYNTGAYGSIASQLALQPPFSNSLSLIGSTAQPLTLQDGFPQAAVQQVSNTFGIDPNFRLGYVQIWNLNVQRELARNLELNLDYTGTKGTALEMMRAPNRGPSGLLLAGVAPFLWESSEADSIAHAGSIRIRKGLAGGFSVGGTYTWAKSIDNASSIGGGATVVAQNDMNLAAERGLSSFDIRQRLSADSIYQLPFGQDKAWLNGGGLAGTLFGDWQLSSNIHWNTGTPYTAQVLGSYNEIASGVNGTLRADPTGAPVTLATPTPAEFFNTAAFTVPPPGQFGLAGRNTIPGPGQFNIDMALNKVFHFGERRSLEVRAQANNLLNMAEYQSINTVVNSPSFGQVQSVASMRTIQLVTRFRF